MPLADTFRVEGGALIRSVVPRRGVPYEHACAEDTFKDVAYAIEQSGSRQFRVEDVRASLDAPFTQVNVAAAFLLERGCIERVRGRMLQASGSYIYEDALIEYHALAGGREGAPGSTPGSQAGAAREGEPQAP